MGEDEPEKMKTHIVIDGNAFYEIDEECLKKKQEEKEGKKNDKGEKGK